MTILSKEIFYHTKVNLPYCDECHGFDLEANKIEELIEGLAEEFVCGCI